MIAVLADRIYVGQVMVGVRPADTRAQLATLPASGGALTVVPGTNVSGNIGGLLAGGSLYVSVGSDLSAKDNYVYRLDVAGGRIVVAGGVELGSAGGNGDGGRAVDASLQGPTGLAMDTASALFIAEHGDNRVRRVDAIGMISTYAGNGTCASSSGSPAPARQTPLCGPRLLAMDRDGNLYVALGGGSVVLRVDPAGRLSSVAQVSAISALRAGRGAILFADTAQGGRLVALAPSGAQTVLATGLGDVRDIAVGPDATVYILHSPDPASPRIQLSRFTS